MKELNLESLKSFVSPEAGFLYSLHGGVLQSHTDDDSMVNDESKSNDASTTSDSSDNHDTSTSYDSSQSND